MKRILGIIVALCLSLLSGCSSEDEVEPLFENFEEKLINEDYEGLYSLLSTESQALITEADFVTRYTNIYSGIQASNIKLEMGEIDTENYMIPFSLSMDTIAGPVNRSDYQFPFVEEEGEWRLVWTESLIFPTMKSGDNIRVITEQATRGSIIDRYGVELAFDGIISTIGIYPAIFDLDKKEEKVEEIASLLDISPETIINKLDASSNPEHFVPIVDILPDSSRLEPLQNREDEGILIQNKQGRSYKDHEAFGRLLGYVGTINAEELETADELVYNQNSIIGKAGLEQVHEKVLRGTPGIEVYIERDQHNIETLAKIEAQHGENVYLSIDSNLQQKVYETMGGERGSATAVDPTTGEILALVSSPSYNSNRFTTYVTRTEQLRREEIDFADEVNRFASLYSPGSTFKLLTAAIGLENGTIDPNEAKAINGRNWQKDSSWGNYQITRVNSQSSVALREAIKFSDNIYFAMETLDMGSEAFMTGLERFTVGTELNIGFPLGQSQINGSGTLDNDILLADSGYGQGEVLVTSLNVALDYSMLANNGHIMNPVLLLSDDLQPSILKENVVSQDNLQILQDAFLAVVDESDGTGHEAQIEGVRIAGKSGTAEIKEAQGDTGRQNGWFVATDIDSSQISLAVMVEDVQDGIGTRGVVQMVGEILADYLDQ